MGQVYKALNKTDNKWYAVKVLPRRSMWNVRLARRQVRSFEQFNHPAVVPFVDVGTAGGHALPRLAAGRGRDARSQGRHATGKLPPDLARHHRWPDRPGPGSLRTRTSCSTGCSSRRTS